MNNTIRNAMITVAWVGLVGCTGGDETDSDIGQLGGNRDGGGATTSADGSVSGGGSSGGASGSTGAGGGAGASGGFFCGEETCGPGTQCCPATGRCYGPEEGGCVGIGCAIPSGAPPGSGDCCADQGLAHCPLTGACHHPDCEGCCPPEVPCNDHPDCPTGMSCCYNTRQCYQPALGECSGGPPTCTSDAECPGNWVCCEPHGICHDPTCTDCCPTDCTPQGVSCAGGGLPCCGGLQCCSGVPIPEGAEYCGQECPISDRNAKESIVPVDPNAVLERLASMDIATWRYKDDPTGATHMGPMAQDFQQAFGLGASDRCIATVDSDGVALAAIQALNRRLERLERDNADLRGEVERLRIGRSGP